MSPPNKDSADVVDLETLGWGDWFAEPFRPHAAEGLRPARVAIPHNYLYQLYTAQGELMGEAAGRLRHQTESADGMPIVGDWVAIRPSETERKATIEAILPRLSCFSRKAAGEPTRRQFVAANIDTVFLVCGLDDDFNLRRIERYLAAIGDSGATAVIVLNKADVCSDVDAARSATAALAPGTPIHVTSCLEDGGTDALEAHLSRGKTVALLGSSGVGKSTIINRLLGTDRQQTCEVRGRDSRGRHTTTQRELILMPNSGLLIDTPGMRELQLWDNTDSQMRSRTSTRWRPSAVSGTARTNENRRAPFAPRSMTGGSRRHGSTTTTGCNARATCCAGGVTRWRGSRSNAASRSRTARCGPCVTTG